MAPSSFGSWCACCALPTKQATSMQFLAPRRLPRFAARMVFVFLLWKVLLPLLSATDEASMLTEEVRSRRCVIEVRLALAGLRCVEPLCRFGPC